MNNASDVLIKAKNFDDFIAQKLSKKSLDHRTNVIRTLKRLDMFSLNTYHKTRDDIIWGLKDLDEDERMERCKNWIQAFTDYLTREFGVQHKALQVYTSAVRGYLKYYRIQFEVREELELPPNLSEEKYAISLEEIRAILNVANNKYKGYFLSLISSGARPGEIMSLRKRDYTKIDGYWKALIPAIYTKKNQSRTIFFSQEVNQYLEPLLNKLNDDDRVWPDKADASDNKLVICRQNAGVVFRYICNKLGYTERYETSGLFKHNLYCFRGYFFTEALRVTNSDTAHAIIGHGAYLSQYQRRTDQKKLDLYQEIEPEILIFDEAQNKSIISKQQETIVKLETMVHDLVKERAVEPTPETKEMILKILKEKKIIN